MKAKQMKQFEDKIIAYMQDHHMLSPGERVVAGISGGADSVCLLFVLLEYQRRYGLEIAAVHVNHGIREEAAADAEFVEKLCREKGITFYLRETDIHTLAAEQKISQEEAGRNFRYAAFEEAAKLFGAQKIAVAHNLNDRCETTLFHLFRGSGIKGLAGIMPVRNRIIRPLLCVERKEIESYLKDCGQQFCHDHTNDEDLYTRNRIRHHILPYVEEQIAPGCVAHIGQTAQLLALAEDYLAIQTGAEMEKCVVFEALEDENRANGKECGKKCAIDVDTFLSLHPAIQNRILLELLRTMSPHAKDISKVHVDALRSLFEQKENRQVDLPFGIFGRREYGTIYLQIGQFTKPRNIFEDASFDFQIFSIEEISKDKDNLPIFPQNQYTKLFDYDKIKKYPVVRTRQTGDYLTIRDGDGELHHKKLKDYMVTEKIPKSMRDSIPVLAEESHVLWLVGYRISESYKIDENTKRVLQVKMITETRNTEEKNGGTY